MIRKFISFWYGLLYPRKQYHVVFFHKNGNGGGNCYVRGKFNPYEVRDYIEENQGVENVVIINWKKI